MYFFASTRFLGLLLAPAVALAQAPPAAPIARLLAERQVLTTQYAAASAQRHGLLGFSNKPSKQDLQEVVTALQGIVDKDEQLVAALNQTTATAQTTAAQLQTTATTLQTTGRGDRNLTAQRLNELQGNLQNAQERLRQIAAREQALTADLAEAQRSQHWRDALVAGLALACVALFSWRRKQ